MVLKTRAREGEFLTDKLGEARPYPLNNYTRAHAEYFGPKPAINWSISFSLGIYGSLRGPSLNFSTS